MTLNDKQKQRIHTSIASGNFNLDLEIDHLVSQGFSKENAAAKIKVELDARRQKLFDQKMGKEEKDEYEKGAVIVVVMLGLIGPLFDITSLVWYSIVTIAAGAIGYWAYKDKPIAGAVGCVCAVVLLPITYLWYSSGRTTIIKIEMLIPITLALTPSYVIGFIVSKIVYTKK